MPIRLAPSHSTSHLGVFQVPRSQAYRSDLLNSSVEPMRKIYLRSAECIPPALFEQARAPEINEDTLPIRS